MSSVLISNGELPTQDLMELLKSDKFLAVSTAFLLHFIVIVLLLAGWQENELVAPKSNTVKLKILMHVPVEIPVEPLPQVQPKPPVLQTPNPIKKKMPKPVIKEAQFAKKRVDKLPKPEVKTVIEEVETKPLISDDLPIEQSPPRMELPTKPTQSVTESQPASQENADSSASVSKKFDASQYFPVEKNPPTYPRRALNKGVQGECTVRYTVNTDGRVESPEVLNDCHAFFIKPSLRATKSFRYTPRIVNGKAVNVANVKNTFQYRIE